MPGQPFDDRVLQSAYQGWMRADRGDHLDDGAWQRLGAGDAVLSERDLLFAHIMTCAQCSEVWRGISFLRQQAEAEGLIERRTPARSWRSWFVPAAIAASLVIAVGAVIVMRPPAPADNVVRGTAALSPVEGLMMAYASDGTPMLLWTPLSTASTYHVEIFSEDGNPLWSGDVTAPPMRWPADAPHARGSYRWRVEAQDGGGAIARSRLTAVELSR
jgi:hypothetical protein